MNRVIRFSLAAGAAFVGFACQDRPAPTSTIEPPAMEIRDGYNGANPHFFFLAPIRPLNVQPPKTAPFNRDLSPTIDICEWNGSACAQQIAHLTMGTRGLLDRVFVLPEFEQYLALWRTDQLHLNANKTYRISVLVGTRVLGFADVDVVKTLREAAKVDRADFVPLLNNLILPIGFRIEQGALCDGPSCDSKSIDLTQGGSVVLATTGDRVDIPAQTSGSIVTVTVRLCDGLTADLPAFGNCVRVTADPPLTVPLSPPATISICSLASALPGIIHAQQDLITLHRQDAEVITALPHSTDFCPLGIGAAPAPPRNFVEAGWRAIRTELATLFGARTLHAAPAVLDVGGGGESPNFSDFQFLLPAKMQITSGFDQVVDPNSIVSLAPSVLVTDAQDRPVGGARVHFHITSPPGTITPTDGLVLTDRETGRATLTEWRVGDVGTYSVQATAVGIADPENNGPAEGFDPFAPAVLHDPAQDAAQAEVRIGTGQLSFTARAVALGNLQFLQQPTNTISGQAITPSLQIRVLDAAGQPLTQIVRVTVGNAPDNPTGCQVLQRSEDAIEGIATFANVIVNGVCESARVAVTAGGAGFRFPVVLSNSFSILAPPPGIP